MVSHTYVAALAALAMCAAPHGALAVDGASAACAVCHKAHERLSAVLASVKSDLELSHEANQKKAQKVDAVQKAQTKRWLKNEYGVALRAGIEEELEILCTRTTMSLVQTACAAFIEEQEDSLPRALLDNKTADAYCAASVPGCDAGARDASLAEFGTSKIERRSEAAPKGKSQRVRGGAVARLVGSTYAAFVRDVGESHRIVLVHNTSVTKEREAKDVRYAALTAEFYSLASEAATEQHKSAADAGKKEYGLVGRLQFGQLNLRKNDVPLHTPLADATGVSILIYLIGERGEPPKSVPAVGEPPLALADSAAVRSQLTQVLLTYLPKRDHGLVTKLMQRREKAAAADTGVDTGVTPTEPGSTAPATTPSPAPPKAAPRRKAAVASREDVEATQRQACDVCVVVMTDLQRAFNETKQEYERSKEYNDRKAERVDKVQKAQTKRWLKNEYRVELAASVEDRLEKVCEDEPLLRHLCESKPPLAAWSGIDAAEERKKKGKKKKEEEGSNDRCAKMAEHRCRGLVEEHAEPMARAALDERGHGACATMLSAGMCEPNAELAKTVADRLITKAERPEAPGALDHAADKVKDEI